MAMSWRQAYEIPCEECNASHPADVWYIIDAEERPDLWQYCRDGTIHSWRCPRGHEQFLGAPLLLHDGPRRRVIFSPFSFALQRHPKNEDLPQVQVETSQTATHLMSQLAASLPRSTSRDYLRMVRIVPREGLREVMDEPSPTDATPEVPGGQGVQEWAKWAERIDAPFGPHEMPSRIGLIESALRTIKREQQPLQWAYLQRRLGTSYAKNAAGDPDENIEAALAATLAALTVFDRQEYPNEWADETLNISTMYLRRRRDDRASNLTAAIDAAREALTWFTKGRSPDRWALALKNLEAAEAQLKQEQEIPGLMKTVHERFGGSGRLPGAVTKPDPVRPGGGRLEAIFSDLSQLQGTDDARYRIALWDEAIRLVTIPELQPKLWATLHVGLAGDLLQVQPDAGGEYFRRAIEAYRTPLAVLNPHAHPLELTSLYVNFGAAYHNRAEGDREENLRLAIEVYQDALRTMRPAYYEEGWARLQFNKGVVHLELSTGDPDTRLADGVEALRNAQEFYTLERDPRKWADIQYEIGRGYRESESSELARNIEEAIEAFEGLLRVYRPHHTPLEWARVQRHLGYLYGHRLWYKTEPDQEDPFERSIKAYRAAQTVFTIEKYPEEWAEIQQDLAWPYSYRLKGDKFDNKERALEAVLESLRVYNRNDHPRAWAEAQISLGVAYMDRSHGKPGDDLERAIASLQNAASVSTRAEQPLRWARIQQELGLAYMLASDRGNESENLGKALEACNDAVAVYGEYSENLSQADSINYVGVLSTLGSIFRGLDGGERPENLDRALSYMRQACKLLPRETYPGRWANFHATVADLYRERVNGDRRENLQSAIEHYRLAQEIHHPEVGTASLEWRFPALGLTRSYAELGAWDEAYATSRAALEAAERTYTAALSGEARTTVIRGNFELFDLCVQACLRVDPPRSREALLVAEEGRSRWLRDQLGALDLPAPSDLPEGILAMEEELLHRLRVLQDPASGAPHGDDRRETVEELSQTRHRLENLWETLRRKHHAEDYVALRRGESVGWEDIQTWLEEQPRRVALLEFYALKDRLVAFLVRRGAGDPVALPLDCSATRLEEAARQFADELLGYGRDPRHIRPAGPSVGGRPTDPGMWQDLGRSILGPLLPHLDDVDILYIVPHGALHRLPLHAMDCGAGPLIERVAVAYAPSIAVAKRIGRRRDRTSGDLPGRGARHLVVGNPTGGLSFAEHEAVEIAIRLGVEPILGKAATKALVLEGLETASVAHLATHAFFSAQDEFESGILLADGTLTAREIMVRKIETRLMVLSACESGLQGMRPGDEPVGLARALLYAGVPTLVLSLWRVDDLATRQFMVRFYDHLYGEDQRKLTSTAEALQAATRETRAEQPHVYHWAPFLTYGDWL